MVHACVGERLAKLRITVLETQPLLADPTKPVRIHIGARRLSGLGSAWSAPPAPPVANSWRCSGQAAENGRRRGFRSNTAHFPGILRKRRATKRLKRAALATGLAADQHLVVATGNGDCSHLGLGQVDGVRRRQEAADGEPGDALDALRAWVALPTDEALRSLLTLRSRRSLRTGISLRTRLALNPLVALDGVGASQCRRVDGVLENELEREFPADEPRERFWQVGVLECEGEDPRIVSRRVRRRRVRQAAGQDERSRRRTRRQGIVESEIEPGDARRFRLPAGQLGELRDHRLGGDRQREDDQLRQKRGSQGSGCQVGPQRFFLCSSSWYGRKPNTQSLIRRQTKGVKSLIRLSRYTAHPCEYNHVMPSRCASRSAQSSSKRARLLSVSPVAKRIETAPLTLLRIKEGDDDQLALLVHFDRARAFDLDGGIAVVAHVGRQRVKLGRGCPHRRFGHGGSPAGPARSCEFVAVGLLLSGCCLRA